MLSQIKGFFYKHYIIYKKSNTEKATLFIYPLVSLFSIGILAMYLRAAGAPLDAVPFVIVGVMAWTFYDLCQRIPVYGLLHDIWDYCLKHSMISPATATEYTLGNSLFGLAAGTFSLVILTLLSWIFFRFNILSAGLVLVPSLAIIFIFAVAVGLGIDSMIVGYNKEYFALVWTIPGVIMVLSGVYYPINMLPGFVQAMAYLLPTTYAIEAIRISLGFSVGNLLKTLASGFVFSAIYLGVFYTAFSAALKKARRTGRTIAD